MTSHRSIARLGRALSAVAPAKTRFPAIAGSHPYLAGAVAGAVVIGPASTIEKGLALAGTEAIDAALLDVNIRDKRIDPVADMLKSRGIPVLFATGYGARAFVEGSKAACIDKPYTQETLASELTKILRPTV